MARNPIFSNVGASTVVDAIVVLLNNGFLRIYGGTQPTTADTPIGAQVLLAELRWHATAFAAAVNGTATANPITPDTSANATGTATWFRAFAADGTTAVFDGSAGTADADLVFNAVTVSTGVRVTVDGYTFTQSKIVST